jgi:hypothetical protein
MDSTDSPDYLDYGLMYDVGLIRITAWYIMQVNGQPAAVNMREMVWDEELARLAQRFSRNFYDVCFQPGQGVTKTCRLSWLTNSALVYEPKCRGKGGGSCGVSANEYSCTKEPK